MRRSLLAIGRAALAQAAKRGVQIGGHADNCALIAYRRNRASARVRREAAIQRARDLQPVIEELRQNAVERLAAIAQGLNNKGITAPRGGSWSAIQVMRVLHI